MRTNTLHTVAVALGLSISTIAQADSPSSAPSEWNQFRTVAVKVDSVPTPTTALPDPSPGKVGSNARTSDASIGTSGIESTSEMESPYRQALSAPWTGSGAMICNDESCGPAAHSPTPRPALSPWFGGADLLFYTLETDRGSAIAFDEINATNVWTNPSDPDASIGFDVFAGRYLDCGRYGFGIGYMLWDPSLESSIYSGFAGDLQPNQADYTQLSINAGLGVADVYGIIYGSHPNYAGAEAIRLRRDLRFQGIEASLYSFGLMGAQRAAYADGNPCNAGYGGAAGPLIRPRSGRFRIMTSHGFRWFQISDDYEAAFNTDTIPGYQQNDIYDNVDVDNNLYGYQFGGMLTYCLGCRMNVNIGGKFGIYGNDVEVRHRVGTRSDVANVGFGEMNVSNSDVVLAALGELDLGLGIRLTHRWTVRGGYRMMGVCGVVDAVEVSQNTNYQSFAAANEFFADDSFILHGGYFGVTCNW